MRNIMVISGLVLGATAAAVGYYAYSPEAPEAKIPFFNDDQQASDMAKATELLQNSEPEEALEIIYRYKPEMESLSENGVAWMELFIKAATETRDTQQLVVLFEFFPEIFKDHENASLLVADAYIANNQSKEYEKIRSLWDDRETKVAGWFVLDVDKLLIEGRRQEAVDLLKSRTFNDKADVGRLVRLALLYANEDPKRAWNYLGEAYAKEPTNSDVRLYRAKLLESVGKYTLAHREYKEAARFDPKNIFLKDQLADFYLRQKQYPAALQIWEENLSPPSIDHVWAKALFWNKVAKPVAFDWDNQPIPQGSLDPLIHYLTKLEQEEFWNQDGYKQVARGPQFLSSRQETYWLRLIQLLKEGQEDQALTLLRYNPFTATSWYPELESVLKRVIVYRKTGSLVLDSQLQAPPESALFQTQPTVIPAFFNQIEKLAEEQAKNPVQMRMPQDIKDLLESKEAFAAVFLAAGWFEAGLQLHQLPVIPKFFPDWVAYALTQAISQNRSPLEALEFASLQKPTPELNLLMAELLIAGGSSEAALEKLKPLATLDTNVGFRAAWLASLIYLEQKDYNKARTTIYSQPRLAKDTLGQETLARIAHLEGNQQLADKLYHALEAKSAEARSYLAKRAFEEHDWKKAKELTEKLIQEFPDNQMLRENLKTIETHLQKTASSR